MSTEQGDTRLPSEPQTIVVSGAGFDAINGKYEFAGRDILKAPKYEMQGRLDDIATTFLISASKEAPERFWKISNNGDKSNSAIYTSNLVTNCSHPPLRGWWPQSKYERFVSPIISLDEDIPLDWRIDPLESFADYKIEIAYETDGATVVAEYNTHRVVLANGCQYFATLFRSMGRDGDNFAEEQSSSSRIELKAPLAQLFPHLLDYLYGQFSCPAALGTVRPFYFQDDIVLYELADYFGASRILRDLKVVFECGSTADLRTWVKAITELKMTAAVEILVEPCAKSYWSLRKRL